MSKLKSWEWARGQGYSGPHDNFPLQGAQISVAAIDIYAPDLNNTLCEAQANLTIDSIEIGVETAPLTYIGPMGYSSITTSFAVVCAEYWYGPYCDTWCLEENCAYQYDLYVTSHNDCVGVVCGENRHCVDGVNMFICTCDSGFTGKDCDINIDECEGIDCSGNGRCIDGVDSFQCECDSGYSGVLCEIAINTVQCSTASTTSDALGKPYHTIGQT